MSQILFVTDDSIEIMADTVHNAYLKTCERLNWSVKEENKVPFYQLSEDSKELDRASVHAVLQHLGIMVL